MHTPQLVRKMFMDLGEGPVWRGENQTLYFVDILQDTLYRLNTITDEMVSYTLPSHPGCFAFGDDDLIYLMLEEGLFSFEEETEALTFISAPDAFPDNFRFNDGKCSPEGRFYVGSMESTFSKPIGSLYIVDESMTFKEVIPDRFVVPNGLAWDEEAGIFYHVDTMGRTVYGYPYDRSPGLLGEAFPAIEFAGEQGNPDGMTMDDEGMLWVCLWEGFKVCRYNPRTGEKLDEIKMPCDKPTSCVFGGEEMKTLYITTASIDDACGEGSGSLFKVELDVGGQELHRFKTQ